MKIKHILIAVSESDYRKYIKLKDKKTWREVLTSGLGLDSSISKKEE